MLKLMRCSHDVVQQAIERSRPLYLSSGMVRASGTRLARLANIFVGLSGVGHMR